ncbi:septum formation initiator family protein [Auraticoccus sp. F435]|uniref:Septum formation initiator family protein n=1 Tax=Auraticoccus cholistanensis TaxID=2656650 RepID=A0A6A9V186_9ACTN|nr:septum formation initiator family protein [Auraticoccus cholistanensis]MVA76660.1 septum formation initiator family protein [Auraticoccus cholistanensis]
MAQRRTPLSGTGPGRTPSRGTPGSGTPRARTQARTRSRRHSRVGGTTPVSASSPSSPLSPAEAAGEPSRFRPSLGVTRRAVAVVVVLAVLVLSYASSLRIYITQQTDAAEARAEIAATQARIDDLRDQLDRWEDPAYVRAQARERLGWVVPGETGYVVIGPDGEPVSGGSQIDSSRADGQQPDADAWWARMAGSVAAADHPAPPPKEEATVPDPDQPR